MSVKIGFVGAGGIARAHLQSLAQMPEAEVAAICDLDRARAEQAAAEFDAAVHINYKTMLEREDLDALYVCVPPFAHADAEILAAQKGIHLFVEKPVALNGTKAAQIQSEIKKAGVISAAGYHWRYHTGADLAREVLQDRKVAMLLGAWLSQMPSVNWWRVRDKSGGQILEQSTHILDLARYFVGEVAEVYANAFEGVMAPKVEDYDVADASSVALRFHSGVIGHVATCDILGFSYKAGLTLLAEDMVVEITSREVTVMEKGRTTTTRHEGSAFEAEDQAFVHAVETGDPSGIRSDYDDAVKTLAVSLAAEESIASRKPVAP